jgi:hypothetical protein
LSAAAAGQVLPVDPGVVRGNTDLLPRIHLDVVDVHQLVAEHPAEM